MELVLELPTFLTRRTDGEVVVTDTRITLYHFLWHYNAGESAESLAADYPSLQLPVVHKLIAFYLENKAGIDCFLADYQAELDRLRAAGPTLNLGSLPVTAARAF